ncbi:pre-mRNA splicing factor, putative [Theileria equi strain WA]|uniref:Pre-mRNA splicing factor, putative n=1 Tax=Theileria equi strain WA TaxID=1537102 RepID=L1LEX0_THEEQ|nr:pre-mRNA splicing factor, putative [Theileria equi strain WA]EKX73992.1 pre-mRNA splicing factor, putative [Theileria equi strain WA]|eukprot:XP_004833444.1 pre-mRNA splicing factor, putative [Theileria equi strain WA]
MVYKGGKANRSPSCVFVGNLPEKVDDRDIHEIFDKYGEIRDIDIKHGKTSNYTSYAFIEFESVRSAEDAVECRDGYEFDRYRLRVEFAGEKKSRRHPRSSYEDRGSRYPPPTRTDYRLVISNLPHGCRWQHLKDHMRKAGPVGYVNIQHGRGYVDFMHKSDMKYALRKLDGTELSTSEDSARIRIKKDDYRRSRSRDAYRRRSHSRGRYASRSGSRRRSRSRSRDGYRNSSRSASRDGARKRSLSSSRHSRSLSRDSRSVDSKRSLSRHSRSSSRHSRSRSAGSRRSADSRGEAYHTSRSYQERSRSASKHNGSEGHKSPEKTQE